MYIVSILRKNPTNALYMLKHSIHTVTLLHVSALKGGPHGTDTFCEQNQQNSSPDVNLRLTSTVTLTHNTLNRNI